MALPSTPVLPWPIEYYIQIVSSSYQIFMSIGNHAENPTTKIIQERFFHIFSTNDSASFMKRQQFPHLVPRYRTDLVTSQVLVPNEHRLQVTSPVMRIYDSETVDLSEEHPIPQKKGFFPSDFASWNFIWKAKLCLLKLLNLAATIHIQRGAIPWWLHKGMCSSIVWPTQHLYPKYEKSILISAKSKFFTKPNKRWINLRDSLPPPNELPHKWLHQLNQLETTPTNQLILSQNLTWRPVLTLKF